MRLLSFGLKDSHYWRDNMEDSPHQTKGREGDGQSKWLEVR